MRHSRQAWTAFLTLYSLCSKRRILWSCLWALLPVRPFFAQLRQNKQSLQLRQLRVARQGFVLGFGEWGMFLLCFCFALLLLCFALLCVGERRVRATYLQPLVRERLQEAQ